MSTIEPLKRVAAARRDDERPDHPLVQRLRAERGHLLPREEDELRNVLHALSPDVEVDTSVVGAEVYARTEEALKRAVRRVSGERWQHLVAGPPEARVRSDPLRVAWMNVTVRCARRFVPAVRQALAERGGHARSTHFSENLVVLGAVAPLSRVLGFADWVSQWTEGNGHVQSRLAEWRIIDPDPDPTARPAA